MIFVIFNDDVDLYFARTRVLERLNLVTKELPAGVVPTLGPDATGVGHVFWYTVEGGGKSLRDLRSLQDWYVRYQLNSVPGVAEVASIGGTVQQYQIDVDPNRLRSYGIPLSMVMRAVMASNSNVGGNVISENGSWSIVRGLGLIENLDDIRNIVVGSHNGTPVFVKDLGNVKIGDAFRTAALVKNGRYTPSLVDRRDHPGHTRSYHLPDALPQHPGRHRAIAACRALLLPADALCACDLECDVACGHRHRYWGAGGCGHCRHRKCVQTS
jgi:Cu/Ag efflux pump CusA